MSRFASGELAVTIRRAVQSVRDGDPQVSVGDAVTRVPASAIAVFLHATFDAGAERVLLTTALGASPGAASGAVVLTAEAAVEAADEGRAVILVRNETSPDDVLGMQSARGIITTRGGLTSHAAVVARGWGIPAVVGAGEIVIDDAGLHIGGRVIAAGTEVSIDGRTGEVFLGAAETSTPDAPEELETLLRWADRIRAGADGPVAVRANADNAADAAHARHLGAEGIGLCRTEHMFLSDDRLPLVRRFILTDDPVEELDALADLEAAQQADFEGILVAMDGLPITIRLLDPPLHEFLPDLERLVVAEALGTLDELGRGELAAVRRLHETNPMIGTRGVRLGVMKPGVYEMQVRALIRAVAAVTATGCRPAVEVMIPLVIDPSEMVLARRWVTNAGEGVGALADGRPRDVSDRADISVGAMIETPRAALVAGELAEVSDFFSFGTNDLTQLTFAFSRDDVGSKLIPEYLRSGLLPADPFDTLDTIGVGRIIQHACTAARAVRPALKIGVCGEQAGDPESAKFLVECGVDYVSCSPYRVPVARLAVAQALIEAGRVKPELLAALAAESAGAEPAVADTTSVAPSPPRGDTVEFAVLHTLRIKGFASAETIAEIAALDAALAESGPVEALLADLADAGLCRHIAARNLWQLSPAGRDHHAALLAQVPADEVSGLRRHYDGFLELNVEFKDLCHRWQTRGDDVNDHADAEYDAARLAELARLHCRAEPVLRGFADAVRRFDSYEQRLRTALGRAAAGETRMFTGVMCGSYHDVWMEMHEDLIQLLGVDRHAEGSY